jgi:hypothetical protein
MPRRGNTSREKIGEAPDQEDPALYFLSSIGLELLFAGQVLEPGEIEDHAKDGKQ